MEIQVLEQSIVTIKADALLTTVRSKTFPLGMIDRIIGSCAKDQFHKQIREQHKRDPSVNVIVARSRRYHTGDFKHVVFVIDDLHEPLSVVVGRGLDAAATAGFASVSLPAIRFRAPQPDDRRVATARDIVSSLRDHELACQGALKMAKIAVYRDARLANEFRLQIDQAFSRP